MRFPPSGLRGLALREAAPDLMRTVMLVRAAVEANDGAASLATGDGANDIPMLVAASYGVAYHAKPKVREQAMVAINEGGLDRVLEVLA